MFVLNCSVLPDCGSLVQLHKQLNNLKNKLIKYKSQRCLADASTTTVIFVKKGDNVTLNIGQDPKHTLFCRENAFVAIYAFSDKNVPFLPV